MRPYIRGHFKIISKDFFLKFYKRIKEIDSFDRFRSGFMYRVIKEFEGNIKFQEFFGSYVRKKSNGICSLVTLDISMYKDRFNYTFFFYNPFILRIDRSIRGSNDGEV